MQKCKTTLSCSATAPECHVSCSHKSDASELIMKENKISTQCHNYCVIEHFTSLKQAYHIDELRVHYVFNEGGGFVQGSPRITQCKPATHTHTRALKYDKILKQ